MLATIKRNMIVSKHIDEILGEIKRIENNSQVKYSNKDKKDMIVFAIIEKEIMVDSYVDKLITQAL